MIKFDKVSKKYGSGTIGINNISFEIQKGEFVFIVGPSGAGKTTIFRLLLRELLPTKGKISISGQDVTEIPLNQVYMLRRKIGTAFQDFKLLFDRTIAENVSLPLEIMGKKIEETKDLVEKVLTMVGLEEKGSLFPIQISGGELQRAVIARAMINNPELLFADEPTGNLDQDTTWQIVNLLKQINKSGTTVIMATHNIDVVDSLSQRVIKLKKGEIVSDKKKAKYK